MTTHNPNNERIKRRYFAYLKEAKRHSEATIDAVAKALSLFEADRKQRAFKAFHVEQAVAFKRHLAQQRIARSGQPLSKATMYATVTHLKRFFQWLAGQPGYKSKLHYSDAEYFNLSEKDTRVATARREQLAPTIEQIKHVISLMPNETEIQWRNRALLAFAFLTGARDSAMASMKLKHVDLVAGSVCQDAREVKTKFSKTFTTYFFPVGDEIHQNGQRLGALSATGEALGERCSALSGDPNRSWSRAPVRGCWPEASPLEHSSSDSDDLPRVVYLCWPAILQPTQLPQHVGPPR